MTRIFFLEGEAAVSAPLAEAASVIIENGRVIKNSGGKAGCLTKLDETMAERLKNFPSFKLPNPAAQQAFEAKISTQRATVAQNFLATMVQHRQNVYGVGASRAQSGELDAAINSTIGYISRELGINDKAK